MSNRETYPASQSPLLGDISGKAGATLVTVVGIQKVPVTTTLPLDKQVLTFVATDGMWEPQDDTDPDFTCLPQDFVIRWSCGYYPAGISYLGESTLAIGNGVDGDVSGGLALSGILLYDGHDYTTILSGATSNWTLRLPVNAGTSGQVLKTDGAGNTSWVSVVSGVVSVAMTGDGVIFNSTVGGSPITSSGTLVPALLTQTANFVLAGPTSGSAATPTFRALVAADIPAPVSGTILWSALGNAAADLTLANAGYKTTFNQTSAVAWLWANTTVGTIGSTNASPLLELAANYWATGGATGVDTWTVGIAALTAGLNSPSTLTFTHTGSTGSAAVRVPLLNIGGTDAGISRLGAASLAIGNGTANDVTGTLSLATVNVHNGATITATFAGATSPPQMAFGSAGVFGWTASSDATASFDTQVGRKAANSIQIFNNTALGYLTVGGIALGGTSLTSTTHADQLRMYTGTSFKAYLDTAGAEFGMSKDWLISWFGSSTVTGSEDTGISRLGAASLAIGNGTAGNTTGNLSLNRVSKAGADFAGQATITTGNTTQAVSFGANYTGTGQPVIVLTPTSDPLVLGVPVGYWVTYSGSAGAWTGFTVNIQTALAGNVTFNYIVVGVA